MVMSIGKGMAHCPYCKIMTQHFWGKSVMGKTWKECRKCGRTSTVD